LRPNNAAADAFLDSPEPAANNENVDSFHRIKRKAFIFVAYIAAIAAASGPGGKLRGGSNELK
jgi:hypothetical protein